MGKKTDIREQLIESAIELMSSRSYASVGLQELCNSIDVTKGGFYHHFKSKRELTLAAIDSIWQFYQNDFLEPVFKTDASTYEKFNRIVGVFYEHYFSEKEKSGHMNGCRLGNLAVELSTQDEEIREKLETIFQQWVSYFERVLKEGVYSGELPENTDTETSARSILAFLEGLALMGKTFNDPGFMNSLQRAVLNLIMDENQQKIKVEGDV